jgi:hypothetical protein
MPATYERLLGRVPIFCCNRIDLRSFVDQAHVGGFYELLKRILDKWDGRRSSRWSCPLLPWRFSLTRVRR